MKRAFTENQLHTYHGYIYPLSPISTHHATPVRCYRPGSSVHSGDLGLASHVLETVDLRGNHLNRVVFGGQPTNQVDS
jgi:hypothetical protein